MEALVGDDGDFLQAKMAELDKTKEELDQARDTAMQSWLDSKPVIDELEKLQSKLASAKNRTSMSNIVISEIELQLEATNMGIKTKMDEELEATKMINELTQALDQMRQELEIIKKETDEERRERMKLRQVLRMRRQGLRTLQLMVRAARIESEAIAASEAETNAHINTSETDNTTVQVTQEDYQALTKRAKEETSLAEWRINVSKEQKLAAEASRNLALSRLNEINSNNKPKRRRTKTEMMTEGRHKNITEAEEDANVQVETKINARIAAPKARDLRNSKQETKRPISSGNELLAKKKKKKKQSILSKLRHFLARSISKLFG